MQKNKETLELIRNQGIEPEIIEYLKTPPNKAELKNMLTMLNMEAEDVIRKQEKIFKEYYKGRTLDEEEWLNILINNPKLIERPIVIKNGKATIGRPPENVLNLL